MKVFYTLLLSGLLALLAPGLIAQDLGLSLTDADGAIGETVCLDFVGENFDSLAGFQFSISYDPAVLEFSSATGVVGGADVLISASTTNPGSIRVSWVLGASGGITEAGPFDFGDLCFVILADGETEVSFVDMPIPIEFQRANNASVADFDLNDGTVNSGNGTTATCTDGTRNGLETGVDCGGPDCPPCTGTATCTDGIQNGDETGVDCGGSCSPCSTQGDGCVAVGDATTFCLPDVCEPVGGNTCIEITASNFDEITSFQFDVNYEGDILDFTSSTFSSSLNADVLINERSDGSIRVLYSDFSQTGVTLDDNTTIVTLCFDVESEGTSALTGGELFIADEDGALPGSFNNGSVNSAAICDLTPTCDDGVRNGDETGVDCGGSCAPCQTNTCGEGTDDVVVCVGSICADAGAEVCVPITIGNFDDLGGLQFALAYSSANLTFTRIVSANTDLGDGTTTAIPSDGLLSLVWNDLSGEGLTFPADQPAYLLCFTVNNAEPTPITFNNPNTSLRAFSDVGIQLPISGTPGAVNVNCTSMPTCDDGVQNGDETGIDCGGSCAPCGGMFDNLTFRVSDEFGTLGSEVCVEVRGFQLNDFNGLQLPFSYDPDKLTFTGATGAGIFASSTTTNPAEGDIRVSWSSADGGLVSVPDSTLVLELCFTVVEQCITTVELMDVSGFPILVSDASGSGSISPVDAIPGTVNAGIPCDDAEPPGNVVLRFNSGTGAVGEEVCLDLRAEDFRDLTNLTFSLSYDADLITFSGANNFGLADLGAGNLSFPSPGVITFEWDSPTAGGETLADGTVVFSLCFTLQSIIGSSVDFVDDPVAIFAGNSNGSIVRVVPVNGQINPNTPMVDRITYQIGSGRADAEETICIPVTGFVLDSLVSFQYTIQFDSNLLEFIGFDPDIDFPLPGSIFPNTNVPGILRILWNDPGGNGDDNLADGTILYGLCFRVKVASPALVAFVDGPTFIETQIIQNGMPTPVEVITLSGTINGMDAPAIVGASVNNPTCSDLSNGFITVEVAGAGDYTYAWTGSTSTTAVANNLAAGDYSVTVTSPSGEADTMMYTLVAPPPFEIGIESIADANCNGEAGGIIQLSTIGGTAPFLIDWSGDLPDNVLRLENLAAGFYSVTITDANGCARQRRRISIEEPEAIEIGGAVSGVGDGSGAINIVVEGGTGTYGYAWAGPNGFTALTEDLTGLTTDGDYCVTVTDGNECMASMCFMLGGTPLVLDRIDAFAATCFGDNGRLVINLGGGVAPFVVTVNPGNQTINSNQRIIEFEGTVGDYTISVTDAMGVTVMGSGTIGGPTEALTGPVVITSDTEDLGCTGAISLTPGGGTAPYTILWNNGETTLAISELCADTYSAVLTDANGCTLETGNIVLGRIDEELVSVSNVACEDGTDGVIDVTISGGTQPYTFAWVLVGTTEVISTTEDLENAGAGDYQLMASDATGASLVRNYSIGQDAGFTVTSTATSMFNGFNVSCNGGMNGTITTLVTGDGTFTYEYLLGDVLVSADQNLTNAAAGTYTVRVTGNGGCEATRTVIVTQPTAISVAATISPVSCSDETDGSITIDPSGGVAPYSFAWSTGSVDSRIFGLGAGNYTLTLTDGNDCEQVEAFTIAPPEDLAFTFEATDATDGCNGSIEILPLGGTGSYVYSWPELPNQGNDPFAEGLCPGEYTLIVTDENDCQSVTMVATVRDRRAPCLSAREVITPNQDGLNETLVIFCSGDDVAADNTIQIYNRWGQLVFETADYDCSDNGGINCFDGRTNDGALLPEGAYYFIFDYTNPIGEREQQQGSFTLLRE